MQRRVRTLAEDMYQQVRQWDRSYQMFFAFGVVTILSLIVTAIITAQPLLIGGAVVWVGLLGFLAYMQRYEEKKE